MPRVGEKQVGRRSHLWAFVRATMPELGEQFHAQIVQDMIGSEKHRTDSEFQCTDEVIANLDPDSKKDFKDLDQQLFEDNIKAQGLLLARKAHDKATPGFWTPFAIKALEPPVPAAIINWDPSNDRISAYYHGTSRPFSTSRSYRNKYSKLQCLTWAVTFLWKKHAEMKGEGGFAS
jgi:hypothetical protein